MHREHKSKQTMALPPPVSNCRKPFSSTRSNPVFHRDPCAYKHSRVCVYTAFKNPRMTAFLSRCSALYFFHFTMYRGDCFLTIRKEHHFSMMVNIHIKFTILTNFLSMPSSTRTLLCNPCCRPSPGCPILELHAPEMVPAHA